MYDGLYYTLKKIKPGTKVENGNIVRTGNKTKLKIVYRNGDLFNVGEGTSYKVSWKQKNSNTKEEDPSTISIIHGSLRGIISKKGPRSGMTLKSKNAVMGVRGTDFHIRQQGTSGFSSLTVIRGKVDVANIKTPNKILKVKQGFSAELASNQRKKAPEKIELVKTSKQELVHIQKNSKIDREKMDNVVDKNLIKEIEHLEKQCVKNTLEDIKEYQPEVYKEIKDKKVDDIESVNTIVVAKAFEKAPVKKVKQSFDDIDMNLEENVYDKYFKVD